MLSAEKRKRLEDEARDLHNHLIGDDEVLNSVLQGLGSLYAVQMTVSSLVDGCIPETGEHASPDQIRTYFLALSVELMELLQELSWKPWKNFKHPDKTKVAGEFADILAFLGIIIIYLDSLGISTSSLARAYTQKSRVNIERMLGEVEDYDKPAGP